MERHDLQRMGERALLLADREQPNNLRFWRQRAELPKSDLREPVEWRLQLDRVPCDYDGRADPGRQNSDLAALRLAILHRV